MTGMESGDFVEILLEFQKVMKIVTSSQFLIDSEAVWPAASNVWILPHR